MRRACCRAGASRFFCQLIPRVIVLVFPLVSAAINDENYFKFRWLWYCAVAGQGHHLFFHPFISLSFFAVLSRWGLTDPESGTIPFIFSAAAMRLPAS